jgi:hypothetical protein
LGASEGDDDLVVDKTAFSQLVASHPTDDGLLEALPELANNGRHRRQARSSKPPVDISKLEGELVRVKTFWDSVLERGCAVLAIRFRA